MERGREEEETEYGDGSSGSGDARPWLRLRGYAGSASAARRAAAEAMLPSSGRSCQEEKGGSASSCFCGRVPELDHMIRSDPGILIISLLELGFVEGGEFDGLL